MAIKSNELVNILNPDKRRQLEDTTRFDIVPVGLATDFEEYNSLGVQQPNYPITPTQMRRLARNTWVEAVIRAICNEIGKLRWQIIPKEKYMYLYGEDAELFEAICALEELFDVQNSAFISFSDTLKAVVRDLLIMDGGTIEIIRKPGDPVALIQGSDRQGRIVGFMPRDPATIYIDHDEHQIHRRYLQTGLRARSASPAMDESPIFNIDISGEFAIFDRHNLIYIRLHPQSGSAYGSPPIISLIQTLTADMNADMNIARFMATGGILPGFISVDQKLDGTSTKKLEAAFRRMHRTGAREMPIISGGGETKFVPITPSSDEMEMNQLQNYLRQKLLAIYQVPPHILGLTEGVNRGIAFAQNDNFWAGAIMPIVVQLQRVLTDRVCSEFDPRLEFRFLEMDAFDLNTRIEQAIQLEGLGVQDEVAKFRRLGVPIPRVQPLPSKMQALQLEGQEIALQIQKAQLAQQIQVVEQGALQLQSIQMQLQQGVPIQPQKGGGQKHSGGQEPGGGHQPGGGDGPNQSQPPVQLEGDSGAPPPQAPEDSTGELQPMQKSVIEAIGSVHPNFAKAFAHLKTDEGEAPAPPEAVHPPDNKLVPLKDLSPDAQRYHTTPGRAEDVRRSNRRREEDKVEQEGMNEYSPVRPTKPEERRING